MRFITVVDIRDYFSLINNKLKTANIKVTNLALLRYFLIEKMVLQKCSRIRVANLGNCP